MKHTAKGIWMNEKKGEIELAASTMLSGQLEKTVQKEEPKRRKKIIQNDMSPRNRFIITNFRVSTTATERKKNKNRRSTKTH